MRKHFSISYLSDGRGGLCRRPVKVDHARIGRSIKKVIPFHWRGEVDWQIAFDRLAFPVSSDRFGGKSAIVFVDAAHDADVVTVSAAVEIKALDEGTNLDRVHFVSPASTALV
jgi:hypothetical protein